MNCIHCGATTDVAGDICPICQRPQPAAEGQIPSPAALAYFERIQRKKRAERREQGLPDEEGEPTGKIADHPEPETPVVRRNPNRPPASKAVRRAGSQAPAPQPSASAKEKKREAPVGPRRPSSMPPAGSAPTKPAASSMPREAPRMVRRHEYEAIGPKAGQYDRLNWVRLCIIAFVCVVGMTVGIYVFLTRADAGQYWLATRGMEASMEAYHQLGRDLMGEGSILRATQALEIAQSKDPDNLEVLIDLGRAYLGNERIAEAELAFTRAIQVNPVHPEPYRHIIDIMRDDGRNYHALQLAKIAYESTEDEQFDTTYKQLLPKMPTIQKKSLLGGNFDKDIEVELWCEDEEAIIYYTMSNSALEDKNPIECGEIYDGAPIPIMEEEDGGWWKLRAVSMKGGMYSEEFTQTYYINKPRPSMPSIGLQTGTYSELRTVPLRAGKDSIAIFYTTDGTDPTTNAKLYTEPIQLRNGKTTIKAIAVNADGKTSNIMEASYQCNVRTKTAMSEDDVIDTLQLNRTTMEAFIEAYGKPLSEETVGAADSGFTKLTYAFGCAVFVEKVIGETPPVLVQLVTQSSAFSAPRGTAVGNRLEDVLALYRDDGGEDNALGQRLLYKKNDGALGMLERQDDAGTEYKIGYYVKLSNGQYIELSYFTKDGLVVRIEWLQYNPAS